MWLLFAAGSAFFAGITSILAKLGLQTVNSTLATALRTIVVAVFAWLIVFLTGAQTGLTALSQNTLLFLVLSGFATGASWLCYFRALQSGPVSQAAAIDKSSTVITIVLSFVLLHETVRGSSILGTVLIALGTWFMLDPNPFTCRNSDLGDRSVSGYSWIWYALGSAVFASLSAITGKVGIDGVDSNLGTAIRTMVVLVMSWIMVLVSRSSRSIGSITCRELLYLLASGLATGASWLCYYHALHTGPASAVVPVDKLSILITVFFSVVILHETLPKRSVFGLILLTGGTLLMVL